jgi:hypothetical protein
MSRGKGGYIGFNRVPAAAGVNSAASGVWTVREAESLKRAGTWPRAFEDPISVSGLQLWLDASDASTLYDATTGGSLVAADGAVKRWEDKSGNNRHATQSTDANRPVRKTAVQNGLDVLRFDGSNDFLSIGSSTSAFKFLHSTDATVFVAVKAGTTANPETVYALLGSGTLTSSQPNYVLAYEDRAVLSANDWARLFIAGGAGSDVDVVISNVTGFTANTYKVVTAISQPTASGTARSALRINGGAATSNNTQSGTRSTANAQADLHIAATSSPGLHLPGDICEIIIYDSALSSTDRAAVEDYLLAKWGIT